MIEYGKAMLAGLLHDCAKCLSTDKKIGLCVKKNIDITEVEMSNPGLLHAKAGMVLAEEEYGVKDTDILHAIRVHTTGEADMGLLDKILFVADYIEPNRCEAPRLEEIRKLAFSDLDRTVAEILYDTINFLNTKSGAIDPTTQITYNYKKIVEALEDKKAEDITVLDIGGVSSIADYFIIANGNNANQLTAMEDAVDEAMYTNGVHQKQVEGTSNSTWILMDYQDIIVHLFSKEDRQFYDLDRIWRDGKVVDVHSL